jgi:hypothetical protein
MQVKHVHHVRFVVRGIDRGHVADVEHRLHGYEVQDTTHAEPGMVEFDLESPDLGERQLEELFRHVLQRSTGRTKFTRC